MNLSFSSCSCPLEHFSSFLTHSSTFSQLSQNDDHPNLKSCFAIVVDGRQFDVDFMEISVKSGNARFCWMRVMEVEWRSLAVSHRFAVARRPFVETRVSSSGKTWLAKLVETVIIGAAQG